jgi:hypothetical protein
MAAFLIAAAFVLSIGQPPDQVWRCEANSAGADLLSSGRVDEAVAKLQWTMRSKDRECIEERWGTLALLAEARVGQGANEEAVALLRESMEMKSATVLDNRQQLLASLLSSLGRPAEAAAAWMDLADLIPADPGLAFQRGNALRYSADASLAAGNSKAAEATLVRSAETFENAGILGAACEARAELTRLLQENGQTADARRHLEAGLTSVEEGVSSRSLALGGALECLSTYLTFLANHGTPDDVRRVEALKERVEAVVGEMPKPELSPLQR